MIKAIGEQLLGGFGRLVGLDLGGYRTGRQATLRLKWKSTDTEVPMGEGQSLQKEREWRFSKQKNVLSEVIGLGYRAGQHPADRLYRQRVATLSIV